MVFTVMESLATSTSGFEPVARNVGPSELTVIVVPATTQYPAPPLVVATHRLEVSVLIVVVSVNGPDGAAARQTANGASPKHRRASPETSGKPPSGSGVLPTHWPALGPPRPPNERPSGQLESGKLHKLK